MPSSTRTVNISLVEQSLAKRTYYFTPRLSSADGDVVLNKVYKGTTNASGDATIALPTKASGTITYDYKLPTSVPGVYSEGTFHLSAGSAIDLEDLIAAGGSASSSTIDYVDAAIAAGRTVPTVDAAIARYDGTGAKLQNSLATVDDLGGIRTPTTITVDESEGTSLIGSRTVTIGKASDSFITVRHNTLNQWHCHPNGLMLDTTGRVQIGDGEQAFGNRTCVEVWDDEGVIDINNIVGEVRVGDVRGEANGTLVEVDDTLEQITLTSTNLLWNGLAVTIGAANSGGAGKRALTVPN